MSMTPISAPAPASAASRTAPALELSGVTKRFRQGSASVTALREVDLSVAPGEFIAVMGASGSGKSTLLHVIAGLTRSDEGRVTVDGQDLSRKSVRQLTLFRRRNIGLVFQAFNLIPSLSAEDHIRLPLLVDRRLRDGLGRVEPLLDRLEIADRRRHKPDALSGGEQQRVAIARALVTDPSLILADEPTGSLDSTTGQSICRLLRDLSREQRRSIVVVTHEPAVAIWAQRVIVLKDGHNIGQFSTADVTQATDLAARCQSIVNSVEATENRV